MQSPTAVHAVLVVCRLLRTRVYYKDEYFSVMYLCLVKIKTVLYYIIGFVKENIVNVQYRNLGQSYTILEWKILISNLQKNCHNQAALVRTKDGGRIENGEKYKRIYSYFGNLFKSTVLRFGAAFDKQLDIH